MEFTVESMLEHAQANLPPLPPHMSKEEYSAMKQEEKQTVLEIRSKALELAFSDEPSFRAYLDMQARLPNRSAGNTLLILAQRPDATDVRYSSEWENTKDNNGNAVKTGCSIRTGEKGIRILNPHEYAVEIDGRQTKRTGFNVGYVFDVSQTIGGESLAKARESISPEDYLNALLKTARFRLIRNDASTKDIVHDPNRDMRYILAVVNNSLPRQQGAIYDPQKRVMQVRSDMTPEQSVAAFTRCLAMDTISRMNREDNAMSDPMLEASGAAYIVLKRFGVDTSHITLPDIDTSVLGNEPSDLNSTLDRIQDASNSLTNRVSNVLEQGTKEKNTREGR